MLLRAVFAGLKPPLPDPSLALLLAIAVAGALAIVAATLPLVGPLTDLDDETRFEEDRLVEMGESRTPRPEPFAGDHYERVRWFVVDRPNEHRHPAGRSSHVPLDRA
jgi:hypothetical protein